MPAFISIEDAKVAAIEAKVAAHKIGFFARRRADYIKATTRMNVLSGALGSIAEYEQILALYQTAKVEGLKQRDLFDVERDLANDNKPVRVLKKEIGQIKRIIPVTGTHSLAFLCADGTVKFWDLDEMEISKSVKMKELAGALSFAISRDHKRVVGLFFGQIRTLDFTTGRLLRRIYTDKHPVTSLLISKYDKEIIGAGSGRLYYWNMETGRLAGKAKSGKGSIAVMRYMPDGKHFFTVASGGYVKLSGTARRPIRSFKGTVPGNVTSVTFSQNNSRVFVTSYVPGHQHKPTGPTYPPESFISVWNADSGRRISLAYTGSSSISASAATTQGMFLFYGIGNSTGLWKVGTGKLFTPHAARDLRGLGKAFRAQSERSLPTGRLSQAQISPDGTYAIAIVGDSVQFWRIDLFTHRFPSSEEKRLARKNKWIRRFSAGTGRLVGLQGSHSGKYLLSCGPGAAVRLWNTESGATVKSWGDHRGPVNAVALSNGGQRLITGDATGELKVRAVKTGRTLWSVNEVRCSITCVAETLDKRTVVAGGFENSTLWSFDRQSGRKQKVFTGHTGTVRALALAPDKKRLLTAGDDKTLKYWGIRTADLIRTMKGHTDRVTQLAISPNGKIAASAGLDKTVILWDLATGKAIRTLKGHTGHITGLVFAKQGRFLFSSSEDGTIKIWKVATGQLAHTLPVTDAGVQGIVLKPKEVYLISVDGSSTFKVWRVDVFMEPAKPEGDDD